MKLEFLSAVPTRKQSGHPAIQEAHMPDEVYKA